ncbi:hypothetical protein DMA10_14285 [Streptomyces sp. WAC 01420]|nr:hypothetical protein DLM49_24665 [Streptomyces sp. WAC 01438]RSM96312.1 hypothetical protein DMA10_14285 [Streptomyces sp. WAC 01420]
MTRWCDVTAHDEPEYDGPEYDGLDALMAALLDEPLPEEARRDPAFLAEHAAAVADLAVLREQLTRIGDALAAPEEAPPGRHPAAHPGKRPAPDTGPGHPPAAPAAADPPPPPVPLSRPHRSRRRAGKAVLGWALAAAAAGLVLGMGWLVTQSGGGMDDSAGGKAAADSREASGSAFGSPRYLACARLVAEGSVASVEPVPGAVAGTERVTLRVSRYYKGEGEGEVTFLQDVVETTPLSPGDRVLVGIPLDDDRPDTVIVDEREIVSERAQIVASLSAARSLTCD